MVRKKITLVVIDLSVKKTSPAGSCILSELWGLSEIYRVHLLATEADPDLQEKVVFHKVEAPNAPLVLRYAVFSYRVKSRIKSVLREIDGPYLIQTTQGQYIDSTVSYPHFCHRAYLKKHWKNSSIKGFRRVLRKLNHLYHANRENKAFKKAKLIVTPSKGLAKELVATYPFTKNKIKVIANPVDTAYFQKPPEFRGADVRRKLGLNEDDLVIAFAALGDFARKGLPELMGSLKHGDLRSSPYKILVVGGKPQEISGYRQMAHSLEIADKLVFTGFQSDIRPYLWASDIFALPSLYEIFSLVCIQAAAAGLPILVSQMHG